VGLLTQPCAAADVDFILEASKLREVTDALEDVFGDLDADDVGAAVRLKAIDVDLIRSTNHPLFQRALQLVRRAGCRRPRSCWRRGSSPP
jgi:hypothetical protein